MVPILILGILSKKWKKGICMGFEGKWPTGKIPVCNHITLEYPKGTGKTGHFPRLIRLL